MLKPKTYNIADSNIAMLGTDLEKKVRKEASNNEKAWTDAGKEVGLKIWRIEKFQEKEWPADHYGEFYSGDSYIVLNTYKEPGKPALKWNVHFWLGAHTSQDEAGTAAYKTVELDDHLGGAPVQYREVMAHESPEFMKLFPNGLKLLDGGIDTGFRKVEAKAYKPRLLHIKGTKKSICATEVSMSGASFNEGDCFLLDDGLKLTVWQGKSAGIFEKNKAMQLITAIKDERGGKPTIQTTMQGDDAAFPWDKVGGKPAQFAAATPDEVPQGTKKLLRLSDASGKLTMKQEAEGKITRAMLDTKDVFIFECVAEVYVWIGKGTTKQEKAGGISYAQQYLKMAGRPLELPISRVLEGGENESFMSHFDK